MEAPLFTNLKDMIDLPSKQKSRKPNHKKINKNKRIHKYNNAN
jgi:hypothetical protein